jgi:hypothetical protein
MRPWGKSGQPLVANITSPERPPDRERCRRQNVNAFSRRSGPKPASKNAQNGWLEFHALASPGSRRLLFLQHLSDFF